MRIDSTLDLVADLKSLKYKNAVITTHHKPDGDAMGSSLGLSHILSHLGLHNTVITPTDYAENLMWLPGNENVIIYENNVQLAEEILQKSDIVFCLDFNQIGRINKLGEKIVSTNLPIVMIDHHQNPEEFYQFAYWNNESSSTCELIFEWASTNFGVEAINSNAANCLYTGLMTDTGNFQYINTSPQSHRVAAELMSLGAKHVSIYETIYHSFTLNRSKLFGYCLYYKLEILEDCKTALIYLNSQELSQFDVVTGDTEGLVNFGLGLKGIVFSVLIIDRTERVKMSFRSKGNFAANLFAAKYFSGGGHINAAGGQSEEPLEDVVTKFKTVIQEYKQELNLIS